MHSPEIIFLIVVISIVFIPLLLLFLIMFFIVKRKGDSWNIIIEPYESFARKINFQFYTKPNYDLIESLKEFNTLNQYSYGTTKLFERFKIIKNSITFSNYIYGKTDIGIWEIFQATISDHNPYDHTFRDKSYLFFAVKLDISLQDMLVENSLPTNVTNTTNSLTKSLSKFLLLPRTQKLNNKVIELNKIKLPLFTEIFSNSGQLYSYKIYGTNLKSDTIKKVINYLNEKLPTLEFEIKKNRILFYDQTPTQINFTENNLEKFYQDIYTLINILKET